VNGRREQCRRGVDEKSRSVQRGGHQLLRGDGRIDHLAHDVDGGLQLLHLLVARAHLALQALVLGTVGGRLLVALRLESQRAITGTERRSKNQ